MVCMKKTEVPWNLIIAQIEQDITSDDEQVLNEWLADSKHQQAYEEICALWKKVQERGSSYAPQPALYWEKIARQLELPSIRNRRREMLRSLPLLYKIAACIAIILISTLAFYGGIVWNTNKSPLAQSYTNVSGKSQVTLPDGTIVWLHSDTQLSYTTDFQKKNRSVRLQGEAYFEVAKDPGNRFTVYTDDIEITVYGTKFNVQSRPESTQVNVSLLGGSVALSTANSPQEMFLQPGEVAIYDKEKEEISISPEEGNMSAAWATTSVQFTNRSLQEICEVLSHRFDITILIDPKVNKNNLYTFTLHDENVNEILELISLIHPIHYSFERNDLIRISQ